VGAAPPPPPDKSPHFGESFERIEGRTTSVMPIDEVLEEGHREVGQCVVSAKRGCAVRVP